MITSDDDYLAAQIAGFMVRRKWFAANCLKEIAISGFGFIPDDQSIWSSSSNVSTQNFFGLKRTVVLWFESMHCHGFLWNGFDEIHDLSIITFPFNAHWKFATSPYTADFSLNFSRLRNFEVHAFRLETQNFRKSLYNHRLNESLMSKQMEKSNYILILYSRLKSPWCGLHIMEVTDQITDYKEIWPIVTNGLSRSTFDL